MQTVVAGQKTPVQLILTKNLDLLHIVYQLPEESTADGPSWSREIK
jgi:hypothetical protein